MIQLDTRLPLGVQPFDLGAVQRNALAAMQQRAAEQELDQRNALTGALREFGPGLYSPDANKRMASATALMQASPQGFQLAAPVIESARQEQEFADIRRRFGGGTSAAPAPSAVPASAPPAAPSDPSLPRGLRNNNPLNLSFVAGQPGVQGSDGRFGRYNTPEEGVAAAARQLQLYAGRGLNTISQIVSTWAPPNENNTQAYIAAVARDLGVPPDQPLDLSDPMMMSRLIGSMGRVEVGRPLDPSMIARGVQMSASGAAPQGRPQGQPAPAAGTARMPGMPTPAQFAELVEMAGSSNPRIAAWASAQVRTWAPFMQREVASEPLEPVEGNDGRPVLVPRSQAVGRVPVRVPSTVVNNNPGENTFDRERGKTLAERVDEWESAGRRAAQTQSRLQRLEELNNQFSTGALAGARLSAGQLAGQLGVPNSILEGLGISREQIAAGEGIRSLTSQMLVGLLGSGGFPSNNFSNADRDMLERSLPSLLNSPQGNAIITQILRASVERDREIASAWRAWSRENGDSAASARRFQLDVLPAIIDRDILEPILKDVVPVNNGRTPSPQATVGGRPAEPPPPATPAPRRGGTTPPVRVSSPAEAQALQPGTRYVTPDGREFTR